MGYEVELDGVSKQYGAGANATAALSDINLHIATAEFISVMGPSGSGKSTLLNLIAGLDRPDRGRVTIGGQDIATLSDDERSALRLRTIGFVFQAFNLFPTFSVEENVGWPLEFLGERWRDARERAAQVLNQVSVPEAAWTRRPGELSGGEQQRVAVARALVTRPRMLLADEQTGNLDSRTGKTILDLLGSLNANQRLTVVLVTHSAFAATYGQRTIELRDGRIVHEVEAPKSAPILTLREGHSK
jgi:putative ABC transport system ATP-binding protein